MPTKREVTLDTWVLCRASEGSVKAAELLKLVYEHCHTIMLDKPHNRIAKEYRAKANDRFVSEWLTETLRRSHKVHKVDTESCPAGTFGSIPDRFDVKFAKACSLSSDKLLVTEDCGYCIPAARSCLVRNGIRVLSLDDALKEL